MYRGGLKALGCCYIVQENLSVHRVCYMHGEWVQRRCHRKRTYLYYLPIVPASVSHVGSASLVKCEGEEKWQMNLLLSWLT